MSTVSLHEAAHGLIAALLPDTQVLHAIAAGDYPHVRTRVRMGRTREEKIAGLQRFAIIDLAGVSTEDDPAGAAAETDRKNAYRRCLEVVATEDGVNVEELDEIQLADAAALYQHLAAQAAKLVKENWPMICRVAHRLDDAGELSGAAIDAVLLEARA
jgi:hypothetical protein